MNKTYAELLTFASFAERFAYLKNGLVNGIGTETFGSYRWLNQKFYNSPEWLSFRDEIITRDLGNEMALDGFPIDGLPTIHHINPITIEDVVNRSPCLFDPNNVVLLSDKLHKLLHYGNLKEVQQLYNFVERTPNDTCPWKLR